MKRHLYPYQKEGRNFLIKRRSAFLADEMGLGKSPQAIKAADALSCDSILVICPKSVMMHWWQEFLDWQTPARRIEVARGNTTGIHRGRVLIINYDKLSQQDDTWRQTVLAHEWDLLIVDEAHALKSSGAKRTKFIYKELVPNCDRVWLLSGTPAQNHAGEMWTHIRYNHPDGHETPLEEFFLERYTHRRATKYGMQVTGSKNLKNLRDKWLKDWMLRRKKKDVLTEMPALSFVPEPLSVADMPEARIREMEAVVAALHKEINDIGLGNGAEVLELFRQRRADVNLSKAFRDLGMIKAYMAADYILENFENRPVLVFGWHRDVLNKLYELLGKLHAVKIDGSTEHGLRFKYVEDFQKGQYNCFIGQIAACGEGINLTRASDVIFVEPYWTPAKIHQAACRAHRIGQTKPVVARMLTINGTVDDKIMRTLIRKANQLTELFG